MKKGRPKKSLMIGSLQETFKLYSVYYDNLPVYDLCADVARSLQDKYPAMKQIIEKWEQLGRVKQKRVLALDTIVKECMDFEEFKGLIKAKIFSGLAERADDQVMAELPNLVNSSIILSQMPTAEGAKMLGKHLEKRGIINPPPGGQVINVSAQAGIRQNTVNTFQPPTMSEHAQLMDALIRDQKALPPSVDAEIVEEVSQ